jgi:hypothetical protein
VCGLHRAHGDEECGFLDWPQNQGQVISHWFGPQNRWQRFVSVLASKPAVTVYTGLTSKPVVMVSDSLGSKPGVTVSSGLPQNLLRRFLPV